MPLAVALVFYSVLRLTGSVVVQSQNCIPVNLTGSHLSVLQNE